MKVLHRSTNKLYAAKIYAGLVEESIITVILFLFFLLFYYLNLYINILNILGSK